MTRFLQGAALSRTRPGNGTPSRTTRASGWFSITYPKDNTPGCTTQACEFRDNIFVYREMGAVILGVSVDDVASHKAFSDEHRLPFPVLADLKQLMSQAAPVKAS